ncbi:GNAT family N-acetyltransferase [Candidatus Latescibacterota bacterium]
MIITSPKSQHDFKKYYKLRWKLLRKPWKQPKGSERDELEDMAFHLMICEFDRNPVGIGRLHFNNDNEAQIRYMAVEKQYRKKGIGKLILSELEKEAKNRYVQQIILNARESAVTFYQSSGYTILEPSHILFNSIRHFKMIKNL